MSTLTKNQQHMLTYLQAKFPSKPRDVLVTCVYLHGDKWIANTLPAVLAERERVLGVMKLAAGRPAYYSLLKQFALDGKTTPGEAATAILQSMA